MKQSINRSKESLNSVQSTGVVTSQSKDSICSVQSTGGWANRINVDNTAKIVNGSQLDDDCKTIDNISVKNQPFEDIGEQWNSSSLFQPIAQRKKDVQAADQNVGPEQQQQRNQQFELLKNQSQQQTILQSSHFQSAHDSLHTQKFPLQNSLEIRNGPILPQTVTNDLFAASTSVRMSGLKDTNLHSEFDVIETKNITDITSSSVFTKSIGSIFTNINKQVSSAITNLITGNDPVPGGVVTQNFRNSIGFGSELRGDRQPSQNFNLRGQCESNRTPQNKLFIPDHLTENSLKNSGPLSSTAFHDKRQPNDQSSLNSIDYLMESRDQKDKEGSPDQRSISYKPSDLSVKSSSSLNQQTVIGPRSHLNLSLISHRQTSIPPPRSVGLFQPIRTIAPVQGDQFLIKGHSSQYPQMSSHKKADIGDWTEERSVSSLPHLRRLEVRKNQSSLFSNKSSLDLPTQTLAHNSSMQVTSITEHYQPECQVALRSESPSPTTAFKEFNSATTKKGGFRLLPSTPSKPSVLNLTSSHLSVDRMPRVLPSPSVPISRVPSSPDCINFPHLSASPSHFDLGEESCLRSGVPCRADPQIRHLAKFTAAWSDQLGRSCSSQQLRQTGLGLNDLENNRARYTSQTLNEPAKYKSNRREYQYQPMIEKDNHYRLVRDSISSTSRTPPCERIEISRLRDNNHLASVASLPRNYPMTQNFKPNIKPLNRERIYSSTRLLRSDARDAPENYDSDSDDEDWC